jgi:hypothetical protein
MNHSGTALLLRDLSAAEAELRRREQQLPSTLGPEQLRH